MRSQSGTRSKGTQEAEWRWLQSTESAHVRGAFTRRFNTLFPKGHRTSLRPFLRVVEKHIRAGERSFDHEALGLMHSIHPEAFGILEKYGTDYTPFTWPEAAPEPKDARCVANSWLLTQISRKKNKGWDDRAPLIFVEGIVIGAVVRPMLHAWNARALNSTEAIDWTQYAVCRWSRYIGIPFTPEEHRQLRLLTPLGTKMQMLFWKKYFTDRARAALVSLLEERKSSK